MKNAERPVEYKKLFTTLLSDWREKWHEGSFLFLFMQLPNFVLLKKEPSNSDWALIPEA
jgi:sialate O-acetylesterase